VSGLCVRWMSGLCVRWMSGLCVRWMSGLWRLGGSRGQAAEEERHGLWSWRLHCLSKRRERPKNTASHIRRLALLGNTAVRTSSLTWAVIVVWNVWDTPHGNGVRFITTWRPVRVERQTWHRKPGAQPTAEYRMGRNVGRQCACHQQHSRLVLFPWVLICPTSPWSIDVSFAHLNVFVR